MVEEASRPQGPSQYVAARAVKLRDELSNEFLDGYSSLFVDAESTGTGHKGCGSAN
jgi:hypothetical protein